MLEKSTHLIPKNYDIHLFRTRKHLLENVFGKQLNVPHPINENLEDEEMQRPDVYVLEATLTESHQEPNTMKLKVLVPLNHTFEFDDKKSFIYVIDTTNINNIRPIFEGRITSHTLNFSKEGYVIYDIDIEGSELLLNDFSTRWGEYKNISCAEFFKTLVNEYNRRQPDISYHFIPEVIDEHNAFGVNYTVGYNTYWNEFKERLIDREGGSISIQRRLTPQGWKYFMRYLIKEHPHPKRGLYIGKDIISYKKTTHPGAFSRLYPLGADIEGSGSQVKPQKVGIHTVNNGCDFIEDSTLHFGLGVVESCQVFEDYHDPRELLKKAWDVLKKQQVTESWEVEAVDNGYKDYGISNFHLGNTYSIHQELNNSTPMVNLKLIEKEINCLDLQKLHLTFGAKKYDLFDVFKTK